MSEDFLAENNRRLVLVFLFSFAIFTSKRICFFPLKVTMVQLFSILLLLQVYPRAASKMFGIMHFCLGCLATVE